MSPKSHHIASHRLKTAAVPREKVDHRLRNLNLDRKLRRQIHTPSHAQAMSSRLVGKRFDDLYPAFASTRTPTTTIITIIIIINSSSSHFSRTHSSWPHR